MPEFQPRRLRESLVGRGRGWQIRLLASPRLLEMRMAGPRLQAGECRFPPALDLERDQRRAAAHLLAGDRRLRVVGCASG